MSRSIVDVVTRKRVLIISTLYIFFSGIFFFFQRDCFINDFCRVYLGSIAPVLLLFFSPLLPVFVLSLVAVKIDDKSFASWVRFSVVSVPILMAIALFLFYFPTGNGLGIKSVVSASFNVFLLGILFLSYFLSSLVIIFFKRFRSDG